MARIVDFNINNAKHIPSTSSSCNIVINNTKTSEPQAAQTPQIVNPPEYPQRLVYPPPLENPPPGYSPCGTPNSTFGDTCENVKLFPSANPYIYQSRSVNVETIPEVKFEELYKLLALTFSNILKDNNSKLIANLIDNSGKIIIDATSLIRIIALLCGALDKDIHIEYVNKDKEGGCMACSKINPIKQIENIKIGYIDFKLGFNDKYNMLCDTFNISLRKCIIL